MTRDVLKQAKLPSLSGDGTDMGRGVGGAQKGVCERILPHLDILKAVDALEAYKRWFLFMGYDDDASTRLAWDRCKLEK